MSCETMTKEEFLKTETGKELIDIALMLYVLSDPTEKLLNDNYYDDLRQCEERLNNYQLRLRHIFGTEYSFIQGYDYSEECYYYYGLYSFKEKDFLYKRILEYNIH